ncbi:MAG: ATP-binding protein [Candidatus Cloacimonetes bacterium]|nr:ATP-binding protein [Candidatus Cloacimonadota bacterium]
MKKFKDFLYFFIIIIYVSFILFQVKKYSEQKKHEIFHSITISSILDKYLQSAFYSLTTIEDLYFERFVVILDNFDESNFPSMNYPWINKISYVNETDFSNFLYTIDNEFSSQTIKDIKEKLHNENYIILDSYSENEPLSWFISKKNQKFQISEYNTDDLVQILKPLYFKEIFIDLDKLLKDTFKNEASLIKYVAIQDSNGIIAATENLTQLDKIESSNILKSSFKDQILKHRFIRINNTLNIEIITPITHNNTTIALLRFCMNVNNIRNLFYQTIFFILIYTIIFIILIAFLYKKNMYDKQMYNLQQRISQSNHLIEIGKLGAELAHEIKNPLNSISMILQRITQSKELSIPNQELLNMSNQEILRLNEIINKFLNYSKIDTMNFKKNDFYELSKLIINLFSIKAQNEEIYLKDLSNQTLIFNFDFDALKQVMINIILNSFEAFHHTQTNNKTINIQYEKNKENIIITIKDNAKGIAQENVDKIFDLFFTKKENGSGIGLALVKKIIKAHNGEVSCYSKQNEGTEIKIIIPN